MPPVYALIFVMLTRARLPHAAPCERGELVPKYIPLPLPPLCDHSSVKLSIRVADGNCVVQGKRACTYVIFAITR